MKPTKKVTKIFWENETLSLSGSNLATSAQYMAAPMTVGSIFDDLDDSEDGDAVILADGIFWLDEDLELFIPRRGKTPAIYVPYD